MGRFMELNFVALGCIFSDRDHDEGIRNSIIVLWYRVCFPLFVVILYAIFKGIFNYFRGEIRRRKYEVDRVPTVMLISVVVFFSFIIDIASDLFKMLDCIHIQNTVSEDHPYRVYDTMDCSKLWTQDTAVTCWERDHFVSAILAAIGLFFCLGMIVFVFVALNNGLRTQKLRKRDFQLRFGFLYMDYKKKGVAVFWELVITARKIPIAALSVHASMRGTPNTEIGMMALVLFTAIALQSICQPFEEASLDEAFPSYAGTFLRRLGAPRLAEEWVAFNKSVTLNAMEVMSLYMSLSLYLVAMAINSDDSNDLQVALLLSICLFLNGLYLAFMVYRIYYALHHSLDISARDIQLVGPDELKNNQEWNAWMVYKVTVLIRHKLANRAGNGARMGMDNDNPRSNARYRGPESIVRG